jgi:flagellar motor switch protein FliN/FliY
MANENETSLSKMDAPDLSFDPSAQMTAGDRSGPVTAKTATDLEQMFDVPVTVSAVLGATKLAIGDLLRLSPGAVLELDKRVGEAIDILVNDRLVARGEVVVVEEKLGVTMTEIIKAER